MTKLLKSAYGNVEVKGGQNRVWGNEWIGNDEENEIVFFYCFGDSEENTEAITKIKQYQAGKDYILSHNQKSFYHPSASYIRYDKYEILNSQLKKDLKKILNEYSDIDEKIENIEYNIEHLDSLVGVIKPIKPIKPIRPLGKPKDNEEWKRYNKEMTQYHREMERYSREMQEYAQKITKHAQNLGKSRSKTSPTNPKQSDTLNHENKNQWNWPAFWVGIAVASLILGLVLIIAKLFKKKNS